MTGGLVTRFLLILATLVVGATQALAANPATNPDGSFNILTSPLPVSLTAKPGTSVSTPLRLKNLSNAPETLKVSLLTFSASGEAGTPALLDPKASDQHLKWAHFSQDTFVAEPNVWKTVTMTIDVPPKAAFGYYYAVVFSRANQEIQPRQANLKGAVATLVLLEAKVPNAKRQAQLTEFSSKRSLYEFLPAEFTVRLHNDGNVHVAPRGNIFISRGSTVIDTLEVNQGKGNILPGTNRRFSTSWTNGYPHYQPKEADGKVLKDKGGNTIQSLTWGAMDLRHLRFGRYTAHLVLAYNNGQRDVPLESTLTFWVVPWRLVGFGLILIVGLVGVGYFIGRMQVRRYIKKQRRAG